jgi:hypothetical protein
MFILFSLSHPNFNRSLCQKYNRLEHFMSRLTCEDMLQKSQTWTDSLTGCCEHGNEPSVSIIGEKYLDQVSGPTP